MGSIKESPFLHTQMNLVRALDGGKTEKWMEKLLSTEFFGDCGEHRCLRKNVFCIDCRVGTCRHCADSHLLHRRLQICKYVYQYVLRLLDFQPHFDCSQIQAYKINGEKGNTFESEATSKRCEALDQIQERSFMRDMSKIHSRHS
ncbi:PREDICTED: uncharacterized protein LOC104823611 isoform X2 [Tarenaya hassleriana]|nr:PREDICTED: uncharacterized protein LOC104823611 isoform X2 [Tarenaya hassleriana]XP_010553577.1 PREDICTED: uncharacterized protein LOC104823611 isoform X2 [Tarenaya hassleriana]